MRRGGGIVAVLQWRFGRGLVDGEVTMKAFSHVFSVALGAAALPASAAVFTVSNTNDGGSGSLRQAILDANGSSGPDEIHFAISGGGVHTIAVASGLPGITDPVVIDGYTQAGASANGTALGTDAVILIEITPSVSFSFGGFDFLVGSDGSTLRGVAIYGFNGVQVALSPGCSDCVVAGNFIGTDASGTLGFPGSPGTRVGIAAGGPRCHIGGPDLADRNLVSGLSNTGIGVQGDGCIVQNNLVGTDRSGNIALGNVDGISIGALGFGASPAGVGIGGANAGNVIGGNSGSGIVVLSGSDHAIIANSIGLGAGSLATVPNGGDGILVQGGSLSTIGSDGGLGNKIYVNGGAGIRIPGADASSPQGWFLIRNEIVGNAGLGIDLGPAGSTPNDADDVDVGANSLQNFPILGPVTVDASGSTIHGVLHSAPDDVFRIDFYGTACGGNGTPYLGIVPAITDADGNAEFDLFVPAAQASDFVTATASRSEDLATSELAPCVGGGDRIFANGFDPPPPP